MTLSRTFAFAAFAAALAIMAASVAHAFTIDDKSNTTPNGGARYIDPDEQFSGSSSNAGPGSTKYKSGNTTLQFGAPQTFDQRYDSNRLFDPLTRDR
jgi:hypothetical protein